MLEGMELLDLVVTKLVFPPCVCVWYACMCIYVCACVCDFFMIYFSFMCIGVLSYEGIRSPGTGVVDIVSCQVGAGNRPGPLDKQPVVLTTEPSL